MARKASLQKTYTFPTFKRAIAFVVRVARVSEELHHHPDILIRGTHVTLTSTTHDAGNIVTEKDKELMREIEKTYRRKKIPNS